MGSSFRVVGFDSYDAAGDESKSGAGFASYDEANFFSSNGVGFGSSYNYTDLISTADRSGLNSLNGAG